MTTIYVILGAPGVGKNFQAEYLAAVSGLPRISVRDLILTSNTRKGMERLLAEGATNEVEDELIAQTIMQRTTQKDCRNGYILSGYPQTMTQARILEEIALLQDHSIKVFSLASSMDPLLKRLSNKRFCPVCNEQYNELYKLPQRAGICDVDGAKLSSHPTDQGFAAQKRIVGYEKNALSLLEYYARAGRLVTIDAELTIEDATLNLSQAAMGIASGA